MSIITYTALTLVLFVIPPILLIMFGKKINEKKKPVSFGTTKYILISYSLLLFVGMVLSYVLPNPFSSNFQTITNEERVKAQNAVEQFHQAFNSGEFSDIDGVEINGRWKFQFDDEKSLWLKGSRNHGGDTLVLVEKMNSLVGQIEVVHYKTRYILDDYDYTHLMKPPTLTLNQNEMTITRPDPVELKLAKLNKVFTITQFSDESERMFSDHRHIRGAQVLYVRVPDSLDIKEGEGVHLSFLE